jgi:hypothetical protein
MASPRVVIVGRISGVTTLVMPATTATIRLFGD